jgi:alkylhydroperoxidase family enzyme
MDIGCAAGSAHGLAAEQIANLNNYRSDFNFSDFERLVLEYADGMTRTPIDVSDARFTRLREKFTEAERVELSSAIAWESRLCRGWTSCRTPRPCQKPSVCRPWPPCCDAHSR